MDYLESVGRVLARENWKPPTESARIKLVLQPQIKAITVTASPDKKSFTITAPVDHDTNAVVDAMYNGLVRASK